MLLLVREKDRLVRARLFIDDAARRVDGFLDEAVVPDRIVRPRFGAADARRGDENDESKQRESHVTSGFAVHYAR